MTLVVEKALSLTTPPPDVRFFILQQTAVSVRSVKGEILLPAGADEKLDLLFTRNDLVVSKGADNFEAGT